MNLYKYNLWAVKLIFVILFLLILPNFVFAESRFIDIWIKGFYNATNDTIIFKNLQGSGSDVKINTNGSLYKGDDATGSVTAGSALNVTNVNVSKLLNITSNIYLDYGTPNQCVQFDANNKLIASGAGCGGSPDTSSYFRNENFTDRLVLNLSDVSRFINYTINLTLYQPISNITALSFSNFQISNWTTLYNAEASTRFSFANNLTSTTNLTIGNLTADNLKVIGSPVVCTAGNYMTYTNMTTSICADANESIELTPYQLISNVTKLPFSNFQLSNVSNNTLVKGDNATLSLWDRIGANDASYRLSGNVGIGTTSPAEKLVLIGNANISGVLKVKHINATAGINITGSLGVSELNAVSCDLKADTSGNFYCGTDATGAVTAGSALNITNLNASGRIQLNITNCDTIDTNTDGVLSCGTDADSGATGDTSAADDFNRLNFSKIPLFVIEGNLSIIGNVSISSNFSVDGNTLFVDAENNRVGIGTISPAHNLHVIGNINATGSINATRIEANEILVNGAVVNRSIDLSTYTKNGLINGSDVNFSLINVLKINGTDLALFNKSISLDNYNQSIDLTPYQLISNISRLPFSNFRLENVSNNTLVKGDNATLALWNITQHILYTLIYPRESNSSLILGYGFNDSKNVSDVLTVVGSASVFGSLNATYINATEILVNGVKVNRSIDLTPYQMISNVSKLPFSNFQLTNVSNVTPYSQITGFPAFSNFQLSNVSNNTVTNGQLTANITSLNNSLNKYGWIVNNTDFKPRSINITGGAGTMNLTIGNGSLSATISYNGSHFIFG